MIAPTDSDILAAFRRGLDTLHMAQMFERPESEMYGQL